MAASFSAPAPAASLLLCLSFEFSFSCKYKGKVLERKQQRLQHSEFVIWLIGMANNWHKEMVREAATTMNENVYAYMCNIFFKTQADISCKIDLKYFSSCVLLGTFFMY